MDILALTFEAAFAGSLVVSGALLLLTYLAFNRMQKDVRRARMFLMADRVRRFLGAFTFGFLLIAAASVLTLAGIPTAATIFLVVIFLFLGAIVYGSLELFLIIRPRPVRLRPSRNASTGRGVAKPSPSPSEEPVAGGDGPAPR